MATWTHIAAAAAAFFALLYVALACTPTATTSCLNGVAYDPFVQYPCRNDLYYWSSTGCCAQGIPFDLSSQFCCFDGVHDDNNSECAPFVPNPAEVTNSTAPGHMHHYPHLATPFDTERRPSQPDCEYANSEHGCLNGMKYDWDTEYPCVQWVLSFGSQGCCLDDWYFFENQTCCYDPATENYKVIDQAHACAAVLLE